MQIALKDWKCEVRSAKDEPTAGLNPNSHVPLPASDFLLWQLADSAFPTGGFAHSSGLEAARQHGVVRNRAELLAFLETSLRQLERASLPLVRAAHDDPQKLNELDRLSEAFLSNHVANRASRAQGKALLLAVQRIFPEHPVEVSRTDAVPEPGASAPPFGHFAPAFGAVTRRLGLPLRSATRLFCFNHLRGVLAAAVRLNIVGPLEAQSIQHRLAAQAENVVQRSEQLTLRDLAQTAPLLDLWQGTHDRLYSRLFQS